MSRLVLSLSTLVVVATLAGAVLLTGSIGTSPGWSAGPPSEWPQHRGDAARSGFVDDVFDAGVSLRWVHQPRQGPSPAWRGEDTRMPFDEVHQPVVVSNDLLFFGSSAEGSVVALDAASGEERWRYFTDAPVRFAPAVWEDRLFTVSDDGGLHVIDTATGRLLQRIDVAPRRDMLLGNGRMISRWPARGGPVIKDGTVYFGVGIWPSEGVYVCAIDAESGEMLWSNDDSGGLEWDQPHGGARAESGISAQGYLVATDDQLLVPTGRGVPAALSRDDGSLSYFHLQLYGKPTGGATILAIDDFFFNGGHFFEEATGLSAGRVPDRHLMVAAPGRVICADGDQLRAIGWTESDVTDRHGEQATLRQPHPVPLGGGGEEMSVGGAVGGAVRFTGAGDHALLESPLQDAPETFAVWLKIEQDAPDNQRVGIVAGNYPDAVSVNWEVHFNGRPRIYWNRGEVDWRPEVDLRTGEWVHYAFVRDAANGRMIFYLDGEQAATHDDVGDDLSLDSPVNIAGDRRGPNSPWFTGAIDDLRVYDRPLSAEEIALLATPGEAGRMPARGLIAHLPLDERPATPTTRLSDASGSERHARLVSQSGVAAPHDVRGMIAVGETLVVGGPGVVSALDLREQRPERMVRWQFEIEGEASGLAWAAGRLYVSTTEGAIYCFGPDDGESPRRVEPEAVRGPRDAESVRAAMEIIRQSGVRDGYAVDLGCGEGGLAEELARRTNLQIIGIEADPAKAAAARERLSAAGLYGSRVTIHQGDPARTPYPNYFADLVVSSRALERGADAVAEAEMMRVLRPWGGVAVIGSLPGMQRVERGELPGAGRWTHQYADPANTLTSTDERVQRPLGMLWFTDYEQVRMPDRHGRGPAPLFADGRLFVPGKHGLHAVSAYNGRVLWEYEVPEMLAPYDQEHLLGTAVSGSPICFGQDSVYLRHEEYAVRLDAASGEELARFTVPAAGGEARRWGFIATEDGVVFGSAANEEHVTMWAWSKVGEMEGMEGESEALFALDAVTGEHLWTYEADDSIRHNAVAIGDGTVYLIDRPIAQDDLLARQERREDSGNRLYLAGESAGHPFGVLVALDARTGEELWRANEEIFGTMLALSVEHDVLAMSYQHNHAYRLRSEVGGRMAGYRASTGERLWALEGINQRSRIMLNGDTIYAQAGAWNLLTGEEVPFNFTRSYGCGTLAASRNMLVFRSATMGYRDLSTERTENYGGIRPGCWINTIPAGGLVLMPDAIHGCTCSYLNKAHIALQPMSDAG
ncbi:MAG: PQQ-binding-like beta-propeller repeat protein [Armatimonadota bacterium]|jgi:outer membrane protein assembly factor BamB